MARMTSGERRQKQRDFEAARERRIAFHAECEAIRKQIRVKSLVPGVEYGAGRLAELDILQKRFIAVRAEYHAAAARCSRLAGELVP